MYRFLIDEHTGNSVCTEYRSVCEPRCDLVRFSRVELSYCSHICIISSVSLQGKSNEMSARDHEVPEHHLEKYWHRTKEGTLVAIKIVIFSALKHRIIFIFVFWPPFIFRKLESQQVENEQSECECRRHLNCVQKCNPTNCTLLSA